MNSNGRCLIRKDYPNANMCMIKLISSKLCLKMDVNEMNPHTTGSCPALHSVSDSCGGKFLTQSKKRINLLVSLN